LSREAGWDDKARAAGGGMDADRFRQDTDVLPKTPAQPAAPRSGHGDRGVLFSCLLLFWTGKREVGRPRQRSKPRRPRRRPDCENVNPERKPCQRCWHSKHGAQRNRLKGTAGSPVAITNHRGHWIPAFAGMTIKSKVWHASPHRHASEAGIQNTARSATDRRARPGAQWR
jgi:hypothetical protein